MIHELKIERCFADRVSDGSKRFEVRFNDWGYNRGDLVRFAVVDWAVGSAVGERVPVPGHPLDGREFRITYVLSGMGLQPGFVAFGFEDARGADGAQAPDRAARPAGESAPAGRAAARTPEGGSPRTCPVCGKPVTGRRGGAVYCSDECQGKRNNETRPGRKGSARAGNVTVLPPQQVAPLPKTMPEVRGQSPRNPSAAQLFTATPKGEDGMPAGPSVTGTAAQLANECGLHASAIYKAARHTLTLRGWLVEKAPR